MADRFSWAMSLVVVAACADSTAGLSASMTDGTGSSGASGEQVTGGGESSSGGSTGGEPELCDWQSLWSGEPVPPLFSSMQPTFAAEEPAAFDFDGDGDLDLATVDVVADVVLLWRNDGAGGLTLDGSQPAGLGPGYAAAVLSTAAYRIESRASDLDGDGDLDLVVSGNGECCVDDGYYRVLLNDGAGNFLAGPLFDRLGVGLEIADMDGDGRPDLVLPGPALKIAFGDGAGEFPDAVELPVDAGSMSLGDLDGDGDVDVMLKNGWGMEVGFNDGGVPSFAALGVPSVSNAEIVGDLDGDGDVDAASLDSYDEDVAEFVVLVNDGAGGFSSAPTGILLSEEVGSRLRAADLDGDGDLDVTVVRYCERESSTESGSWAECSTGLDVLRNAGAGAFTYERYQPAPALAAVAIADFDGDAAPDLALVGGEPGGDASGGVRIAVNDGAGGFARRSYRTGIRPEQIVAADLDGDGDDDLVTANSGSNDATILVNDGGDLSRQITLVLSPQTFFDRIEAVAPADFDGDGRIDVALASEFGSAVWVLRNLGDFEFVQVEGAELKLPELFAPEGLAAGDLDGDGDADLVTANGSHDWGGGMIASRLGVFENLGDATFVAVAQPEVGSGPESVVAVDVDGDGALDLAAAAERDRWIGVVRNQSGLTFAPVETYPMPGIPEALAAGDLDGDGRPELLVAIGFIDGPDMALTHGHKVAVLWNDGAGGYGSPVMIPVGRQPRALAVGDGDGDGDLDVLVANARSSDVTLLVNDGGTLAVGRVLPVGSRPMGVVFAAIDATCGLEIAVANKDAADVLVIPSL